MGLVGCIARQLAEEYVEDLIVDTALGAIGALAGVLLGAEQFPTPAPPQPAVTVGHQIKHASFLGAVIGAAVGAALTVAAVGFIGLTGGAALVGGVLIGLAIGTAVNTVVGWVDSMFPPAHGPVMPLCSIDVLIDGLPAARAGRDLVACTRHSAPPLIAEGSDTVSVNGYPLARVEDRTACGATLKQGVGSALIGGEKAQIVEISGEFLWWQSAIIFAVGALIPPSRCMIQGLRNLPSVIMKNGRAVARVLSSGARSAANIGRATLQVLSTGAKNAWKGIKAGLNKGAQLARQAANALKSQISKLKGALRGLGAGSCKAGGGGAPTRTKTSATDGTPLKNPKCESGCPVDASTGAVVETRVDFTFGTTLPIRLVRNYDSLRQYQGLLGHGWVDTFSEKLHLSFDGERIDYTCVSGEIVPFDITSNDDRVFNPRFPYFTLIRETDGFAVHDLRSDQTRHFLVNESTGLLKRISDSHGNSAEWIYSGRELVAIHHSDGEQIHVHRTVAAKDDREVLTFIRRDLPAPAHLASYTIKRGLLVEAKSTSASHISYNYDSAGRMSRWSDASKTWATYEYDARGRCIRSRAAEDLYSIDLTYEDSTTRATHVRDGKGLVKSFYFDNHLSLLKLVDPLGRVETFEYDQHGKCITHTTPQGHTERSIHDGVSGLLFQRIDAAGNATEYFYDDSLRLIAILDACDQLWSYERLANGAVSAVIAPDESAYRYTYNARGQPTTITRPDGTSRQFYYDSLHRLSAETDWRGSLHHYRYDSQGRLIETRDTQGRAKSTFYDPRGRVSSHKHADGQQLSYDYDLENNLVGVTNENGHQSRSEFGAFDLQTASVDAEGRRYDFSYDPDHLLMTEVRAPDGARYQLERDATGRIIQTRDYHGSTTNYSHSPNGDVERSNASGQRILYGYDQRGALISVETSDDRVTYERDRLGRITSASNSATTVQWEYDSLGRVTRTSQDGEILDYTYDTSGNCVERTLAPGSWESVPHTTRFSHDAEGQLTELELDDGTLQIERDERGLPACLRSSEGFQLRQEHDARGRLIEQRLLASAPPVAAQSPPGLTRSYSYDAAGNPIEVIDSHWGATRYNYDRSERVLETQRQGTSSEAFRYSQNGLLTAAGTPGTVHQHHPAPSGRLHRRGDTQYTYDAVGRLIARTIHRKGFRPKSWAFVWNSLDQLIEARTPEGQLWRYSYDPLGRRVRKFNPGTRETFLFLWDGDVLLREIRLCAQAPGHEQSVEVTYWHHEPNTFRPIAQQKSGTMSIVVVDAIGTPAELVSLDGRVSWRGQHRTWGQRCHSQSDATETCPIRFQGQYEDSETGLHYNRFRYYDPTTALYLSPDPLGLAGGLQPQAYVASPTRWVDPLGLADCDGKTYQTYTKTNYDTGKVYSGRTSGTGSANQNVARRDARHVMPGYSPATLDKSSANSDAIRGREEQLIVVHGGAQSAGGSSANKIRGIAEKNDKRTDYLSAANAEFGDL